ncbi:DNA-binding protein, partial [Aquimarina sp. RZ0]
TLKRLQDIQQLSPENKSHVFALLDAFIKQTKLQSIM